MNSLNTCAPVVVPTRRTGIDRWLPAVAAMVGQAWRGWRRRAALGAEFAALEGLSDATRRDIGMAKRGPADRTLGRLDVERGRWQ